MTQSRAVIDSLAARAAADTRAVGPYLDALLESPLAQASPWATVQEHARDDATAREVLALHWESQGRPDVCGLALPPRVELAARAYAATCMSACWWWPGRDIVTVSERPHALEFHDAGRRRLKRVAWDGWEVTR